MIAGKTNHLHRNGDEIPARPGEAVVEVEEAGHMSAEILRDHIRHMHLAPQTPLKAKEPLESRRPSSDRSNHALQREAHRTPSSRARVEQIQFRPTVQWEEEPHDALLSESLFVASRPWNRIENRIENGACCMSCTRICRRRACLKTRSISVSSTSSKISPSTGS